MPLGRFVERAADDLGSSPFHRAFHVGHFLGPLVDEQHDDVTLRVVLQHTVGDLLQQHRLPRTRWGNDQATLPFADRRHEVQDTHTQFRTGRLQS
jgi:hypothetical protein